MKKKIRIFAVLTVLALLAGCAGKEELRLQRMLWPLPPDTPRLEFIGIYASEKNLEEKTRTSELLQALTGEGAKSPFKTPMGIGSDNKGVVYIADLHDRNVRVYDFNRRVVEYFLPQNPFKQPIDVKVDSLGSGNIYVSDIGVNRVLVFSPAREPLFAFGGSEYGKKLTYLAINPRLGRIYVADGEGHQIVVFDLQGNHLFDFGFGEMYGPRGVAIDARDRVFVADGLTARILIFGPDGKFDSAFGARGDEPYAFDSPRGIGIDPDGNVYVADTKKSYFSVFREDGALLTTIGSENPGRRLNDFMTPAGVEVDPSGRVFVTDPLNRRFAYWQYLTEAYLEEHPVTEEQLKNIKLFRSETEKKVEEIKAREKKEQK